MNGRFSMNFTHPNNNKRENVYRKGEAQYHNYTNVKRSQPSENILINEGVPSITNTYTTPFTPVNNRQRSMTSRQVVGPGTMSRFLMSPPTGSGCSACVGR